VVFACLIAPRAKCALYAQGAQQKKKKNLGIIDAGILTTTITQIAPTSLQHVKTDYTTLGLILP
jgi:hypothetical protein